MLQTAPKKIWVIKEELDFVQEHAEFKDDKWVCKETGEPMIMVDQRRSIYEFDGIPGGFGEVRTIFRLYCPKCQGMPELKPGEPVYLSKLMEIQNGET